MQFHRCTPLGRQREPSVQFSSEQTWDVSHCREFIAADGHVRRPPVCLMTHLRTWQDTSLPQSCVAANVAHIHMQRTWLHLSVAYWTALLTCRSVLMAPMNPGLQHHDSMLMLPHECLLSANMWHGVRTESDLGTSSIRCCSARTLLDIRDRSMLLRNPSRKCSRSPVMGLRLHSFNPAAKASSIGAAGRHDEFHLICHRQQHGTTCHFQAQCPLQ